MKKNWIVLILALALIVLAVGAVAALDNAMAEEAPVEIVAVIPAEAAVAEAPAEAPAPDPTQGPWTWAYLATIAGAAAATLLIVQFLKVPLDKVWKIPTRVFVYVVALAILAAGTAFTVGLTLENAPLCALNAFIVAVEAYGAYELTFARIDR